jgi:hypothetical protein
MLITTDSLVTSQRGVGCTQVLNPPLVSLYDLALSLSMVSP